MHPIRTIQSLLGYKDLETTMIYIHVLQMGGEGVRSPLDDMEPKAAERRKELEYLANE